MESPRWLAQATLRAWIVRAGWLKQLYAHGKPSLAGSSNFTRMDCPRWLAQATLCAWIVLAGWLKQLYAHGLSALAGSSNFMRMESRCTMQQQNRYCGKCPASVQRQNNHDWKLTTSLKLFESAAILE
jgi:hypothetical protein